MKRIPSHAYAIACLGLLLGSPAAHAGDGVIEINDASILAAGGYPALIATSGSYVLTGNLTPPAGASGVVITASNVTLDLNGFSIDGAGAGVVGIDATALPVTGTTIRNGVVTGFTSTGIQAGGSSKLFQLKVSSNSTGIGSSFGCLVVESTIDANSGVGVFVDRCKVENCVISGNGTGIVGSNNVVVHNQILGNAGGGILTTIGGSTIQQNVLVANGGFGISDGFIGIPPPGPPPPGVERNNIIGNTIEGTAGAGISFPIPAVIVDNAVSSSLGTGITCGSGCQVRGNSVTSNNLGGAPGSGGVVVGPGSNVSENSISFNTGFGLMAPVTAGFSQNTLNLNGGLDVLAVPPGPHPSSGFMNLCSGIPGPAPLCP